MRAERPAGAKLCVMRPPSGCHDRVALPNVLAAVAQNETETVRLPRLPLRDGHVDAAALGAALSAGALRGARLLLLDAAELSEAYDDLSRLLITVKGWLCTLEHKSCQHTC